MTTNRILQLNALITATSAIVMLAARPYLYPLFGLSAPLWFDVATGIFAVYAALLVVAARRQVVPRAALWAFTIGDGACFLAGVGLLLVFWTEMSPIGRVLMILTTLVVDCFAWAQFRAARIAQ
jgi:hypothetical protein